MFKKIQFCIVIAILISACTINEPKLPSWYTELSVYLPTEDFFMEEAINDSTVIGGQDSLGIPIIYFNMSDSTDRECRNPDGMRVNAEGGDFEGT